MHNDMYSILKEYLLKLVPELDEETWEAFINRSEVKNYKKNDFIYQPGQVCRHISFISSGLLRSYYLQEDKEVTTAFIYERNYFSDYGSFLMQSPTDMYTKVLEDSVLINVSYNDLQLLYKSYPLCQKVGRLIAENLYMLLFNRNASFQFDSAETRYQKFVQDNESILLRVPQYAVASYIGITPEALSRIRAKMRTQY